MTMKKGWIIMSGMLFTCALWTFAQQPVAPSQKPPVEEEQTDSVPVVVVVEEMEIDSVPLFTGSDMGMLLTDTVPTPEWMTMQMVAVGAVEPIQTTVVNKINTRFVHRVKDLASKKTVSANAMRGAAAAHDDELKAVLSDQQVKAYQGTKDKIHKRAWYHYCWMCRDMMGGGYDYNGQ
ncbi:MAG: hypothetical protein RR346_02985 [Bacteroidales bacterium]